MAEQIRTPDSLNMSFDIILGLARNSQDIISHRPSHCILLGDSNRQK